MSEPSFMVVNGPDPRDAQIAELQQKLSTSENGWKREIADRQRRETQLAEAWTQLKTAEDNLATIRSQMITDEFGAMVQVLVDDPTAQIQRLKQQLQASEEREKVLREALGKQECRCEVLAAHFGKAYPCDRCAALASTAEPEVTS